MAYTASAELVRLLGVAPARLAGPASCLLPAASHLPPPALRCALSEWLTLPAVTRTEIGMHSSLGSSQRPGQGIVDDIKRTLGTHWRHLVKG